MQNETQYAGSTMLSLESRERLLKIATDHPYFALPWFYLLRNTGSHDIADIEKHRRKAALFFSNTNWLEWQLHLATNHAFDTTEQTVAVTDTMDIRTEEALHKPDNDKVEVISIENEPEFSANPVPSQEEKDNNSEKVNPHENVSESIQVVEPETKNESAAIEFEPLHTVDYFASQGIKITDEPVSTDKIGKQLKSFTEWIKSMKKIHGLQPDPQDPQTDMKIQGIAEFSNVEADVVTEAMADVLVKQDKIDKAIELYEKLSLNNPSKSAYFAAKIESLKSA
jgi:hypothetical protein